MIARLFALRPSAAWRWGNCDGSIVLERDHAETEKTPEQLEGDAAHEMAAEILRDMCAFGQARAYKPGMVMTNGVVVTDEMIESVEVYTDFVIEEFGDTAFPITDRHLSHLHIEEQLAMPGIHPDNGGTPDVWWAVVGETGAYVHLPDFKNGHRFVDPFENLQLVDYVAGILSRPEFEMLPLTNVKLKLSIVQPRSFHFMGPIRTWETTADKLVPFFEKLRLAAVSALGNHPQTRVGPWCYDCLGKAGCPALHEAADGAMDSAGAAFSENLPPDALGIQLRMMERAYKLLEARMTGLQEQALATIKKGVAVPGYQVERGNTREQWTQTPEEIIAYGKMMGFDLQQQKPITPKQAIKAGMDEALVKPFTSQPPGPLKLQPTNTTLARKVFGK